MAGTEEIRAVDMTLSALELDVLGTLDAVVRHLERALGALRAGRACYPGGVDPGIAVPELHARALELLAVTSPSAGDLRLAAALFHVTNCISRMTEQCETLSLLAPSLHERLAANDGIRAHLELMGDLTRAQLVGAKLAFRSRDVKLVERLLKRDGELKRVAHKVFMRALHSGHDDRGRASAILLILISRCLEELDDNAVEIGEQAEFIEVALI